MTQEAHLLQGAGMGLAVGVMVADLLGDHWILSFVAALGIAIAMIGMVAEKVTSS